MALIVAPDGRLVTTIERPDLAAAIAGRLPVAMLGTLLGRTADPASAAALDDRLQASTGFEHDLTLWRHESVSGTLRFMEALT